MFGQSERRLSRAGFHPVVEEIVIALVGDPFYIAFRLVDATPARKCSAHNLFILADLAFVTAVIENVIFFFFFQVVGGERGGGFIVGHVYGHAVAGGQRGRRRRAGREGARQLVGRAVALGGVVALVELDGERRERVCKH